MVRQVSSDCGKSAARNDFLEKWPKAVFPERPYCSGKARIIFIDFLAYLKNTSNVPKKKTPSMDEESPSMKRRRSQDGAKIKCDMGELESTEDEDTLEDIEEVGFKTYDQVIGYLTKVIKKAVWTSVQKGDNDRICVIIGIDKYKYVCKARGIIHEKRDHQGLGVILMKDFSPNLEDPVVIPFREIFADKEINGPRLIRFVVVNIIRKLKPWIRPNMMFIFDGHSMDLDTAFTTGLYSDDIETDEQAYSTPLALSINDDGGIYTGWAKDFTNLIGESDYLPFFYMSTISRDYEWEGSMDIYARDSDAFFQSVIYWHMRNFETHGKVQPNINIMHSYLYDPQHTWIQVNLMIDLIGRDRQFMLLKYPALQLVVAALAAGSDYTERHYFVPHKYFMEACIRYSDRIGDIIDMKVNHCKYLGRDRVFLNLDGGAYVRLLVHAYVCAKKAVFKDHSSDPSETTKEVVSQKLIIKYPKEDKFWTPTDKDDMYSCLQLQYYMDMLSMIGKPTVEDFFKDVDMELYAYAKDNDSTVDVEYTNIKRLIHRLSEDEIKSISARVCAMNVGGFKSGAKKDTGIPKSIKGNEGWINTKKKGKRLVAMI